MSLFFKSKKPSGSAIFSRLFKNKKILTKDLRGFTITEMIVTVSIISILMTVIIMGRGGYTNQAGLLNEADKLELSFKEAQTYATSVKESTPGSSDFEGAYGISVNRTVSNTSYFFFADKNGNGLYDGDINCVTGEAYECLERRFLQPGFSIESMNLLVSGGPATTLNRVDITYLRPSANGKMMAYNQGGQLVFNPNAIGARLRVISPDRTLPTKNVHIYLNGQISVQ